MLEVKQADEFKKWFARLRDLDAKRRIAQRIVRVQNGLLGDVKSVGDGVFELRVHFGPGYRLYFVRRGSEIIILICGGDKDTQDKDIRLAKSLAKTLQEIFDGG